MKCIQGNALVLQVRRFVNGLKVVYVENTRSDLKVKGATGMNNDNELSWIDKILYWIYEKLMDITR
jgi:hypothetical protein